MTMMGREKEGDEMGNMRQDFYFMIWAVSSRNQISAMEGIKQAEIISTLNPFLCFFINSFHLFNGKGKNFGNFFDMGYFRESKDFSLSIV